MTAPDLCIVSLTYTAPLAAIDAAMPRHIDWLEDAYANDLVLVSGRKVPRDGGVIVMRGPRDAVAAVVATDPFVAEGLASFDVTAFRASQAAPALRDWIGG